MTPASSQTSAAAPGIVARMRARFARETRAPDPLPVQIAPVLAPTVSKPPRGQRLYGGANYNRLTSDWLTSSSSFDAEARTSIRTLRNRARQLVRDNEYGKNAMRVVRNNVIGKGIGLQAQVMTRSGRRLDDKTNDAIEALWKRWGRVGNCHTGGTLSLNELQSVLIGAVAESGEVLIRKVKRSFGSSPVPLALEIIEADQLVEEWSGRAENGNEVRMGVEVDEFQRPIAYWLYPKHPGDYTFQPSYAQTNRLIRVPASEIIHLFVTERPGATRGITWMHAALKRLRDVGGYTEAEIVAARSDASVIGTIESPEIDDPTDTADGSGQDDLQDDQAVFDLEAGTLKRLAPGEKFTAWHPTRPNGAMDPFLRVMLRGIAVAFGTSYESLTGDYSQSNFSSSRLSVDNERDNWRVLQGWFIEHFMQPVYEAWLEMAVLCGALQIPDYELNPERCCTVRWLPRGWRYVNPQQDTTSAIMAIEAGLSTRQEELAVKGLDHEDIDKGRRSEIDAAQRNGLRYPIDAAGRPPEAAPPPAVGGKKPAAAADADPAKDPDEADDEDESKDPDDPDQASSNTKPKPA